MDKKEILKEILKELMKGKDVEELKRKYLDVLKSIKPEEIPVIEQELLKEGYKVEDILKFCDLHFALFKEFLIPKELEKIDEEHPLRILLEENERILKNIEAIRLEKEKDKIKKRLKELYVTLRSHYEKNQLLIFPYFERAGLFAIPRVLWGREDKIIQDLRKMMKEEEVSMSELQKLILEIIDLVLRENKILYPTSLKILSEDDWKAIKRELLENFFNRRINIKGRYPYEFKPEELPKNLPIKFEIKPDEYEVIRKGDIDLDTGFLNKEEIKGIFRNLPLEITFADSEDRVRFFSKSNLFEGFKRARTIIGRKVLFCHPPRLEPIIKKVIKDLKERGENYKEFWTKYKDGIFRVLIVAVRDEEGKYLGTLEIVEDFTEILRNPEEYIKKVVVF